MLRTYILNKECKPGYYWVTFKDSTPEIAELDYAMGSKRLKWIFGGTGIQYDLESPNVKVIKRIDELE